jgi:poly-beta-1,6-N-acetyl-D-glucosamine synthase
MVNRTPYIIITPARDEGEHIEQTIISVINQTMQPSQWIIVNDGSSDETGTIIDKHSAQYDWITAVHRQNRGFRSAGGGVTEAFYDGYSAIVDNDWEFVVKLDGDLSFEKDYFEKCLAYFGSEPNLGIAGGTVCVFKNGELKVDSVGDPPFHVRGATKIYRRACWEKISPLATAPGWDTIDEVKANFHGWTTRTFGDIKLIQHKPTGAAEGRWRNCFKNGRANYVAGYHPVFMMGKCFKRAFRKPFLLESIALCAGFCSGYFKQISQIEDDEVIHYLRRQQIRRLLRRPSIYR